MSEQVMALTERQQTVIGALETICRRNFVQYKESCNHLYQDNVRKLSLGDEACVYGNGGLTFQTGRALGIEAGSVLSTFKALERKGLVMREKQVRHYQCALYWWPVGLAAKLSAELDQGASTHD